MNDQEARRLVAEGWTVVNAGRQIAFLLTSLQFPHPEYRPIVPPRCDGGILRGAVHNRGSPALRRQPPPPQAACPSTSCSLTVERSAAAALPVNSIAIAMQKLSQARLGYRPRSVTDPRAGNLVNSTAGMLAPRLRLYGTARRICVVGPTCV